MIVGFYDFAKSFVRTLARTIWRARVFGTENVPADGSLIVACNHVSYLDPPILGCFCPRRVSYMAKKELFEIPVLGAVIRALGAYSVDRQGSATSAVRRSLAVLSAGGVVGIFPEGTRNPTGELPPQTGVALLASLGRVPVVPACIRGTDRALELGRINVAFGRPLALPAGRKATRDDLAKFTAEIMKAIDELAESMSGNS
jgi:1-acyl-sn-glycerol-3-phosphate acyltransferase